MDYKEYEMQIVMFDKEDVFIADTTSYGGNTGWEPESIHGPFADK